MQYEHPQYIQESRMNMFPPTKTSIFYTPMALYVQGIVVCDTCGETCNRDYRFCSKCREEVMIMIDAEDKFSYMVAYHEKIYG